MTTRDLRYLPLLLALACTGPSDDDKTTDDTDGDDLGAGLDRDASGDYSCFTPAATFDAVTWAPAQTPVADAGNVTVNGTVLDFEEETPVSSRNVGLFYDDVVEGDPDVNAEIASAAGDVTLTAPACKPVSYRTQELPGLNEAKVTLKAHQVYGTGVGGSIDAEFQSVSNNTYVLIPTIVSIDIDPTKGAIAGTAYDCARDPDTLPSVDAGKIEGVRVRITDLDGNEPEGAAIKYFVDSFPDRDQPYTSADGLWGAFNVPPGTWQVQMYGKVNGEVVFLGGTVARVYADSINIANIWSGYEGGVKYPAACLDGGGGGDTDETDVPADTDTDAG